MKRLSEKQLSRAGKALQKGKSSAARTLNAQRKTFGAGPGRPRRKLHDPDASYCLCADCRIKRGHHNPQHTNPLVEQPAK